ncbi:hypothetical protein [Paenibacillus qinlingensis]|uniref:hypothetical protein n=1 Tax=Paenibacillus qinlingensis TaxID=1837343 RepID=UPI001567839F|nr:hypothetical protein [Paenibacillus qinlingensis]NQX58647.1 hypothetical protein [Paenibacillus qinlingensis]
MRKLGKRVIQLCSSLGMLSLVISVTTAFAATPGSVIFQSGFEGGSTISQLNAQKDDITGTDTSYSTSNNWVADLEGNAQIGNFEIQYEGGTMTDRYAKIIADPSLFKQ